VEVERGALLCVFKDKNKEDSTVVVDQTGKEGQGEQRGGGLGRIKEQGVPCRLV
jgi:hypothetical protein